MSTPGLLYLGRSDVTALCETIDPIAVMERCLLAHQARRTVLPAEAYLAWTAPSGASARSINMPGLVSGAQGDAIGTKIINANPGNPGQGQRRASGLIVLFDAETAMPTCIMEGGHISALRTASVSSIAAKVLGPRAPQQLAIVGAGELGAVHARMLASTFPSIETVTLFDLDSRRAEALTCALRDASPVNADVRVSTSAREAIVEADLIVPTTTTTQGYIESSWLAAGSLLLNVSLDDPFPEVFLSADKVLVDDWALVSSDTRRILGRLHAAGRIGAPGSDSGPRVAGELGAVLDGSLPGASLTSSALSSTHSAWRSRTSRWPARYTPRPSTPSSGQCCRDDRDTTSHDARPGRHERTRRVRLLPCM